MAPAMLIAEVGLDFALGTGRNEVEGAAKVEIGHGTEPGEITYLPSFKWPAATRPGFKRLLVSRGYTVTEHGVAIATRGDFDATSPGTAEGILRQVLSTAKATYVGPTTWTYQPANIDSTLPALTITERADDPTTVLIRCNEPFEDVYAAGLLAVLHVNHEGHWEPGSVTLDKRTGSITLRLTESGADNPQTTFDAIARLYHANPPF